MAEENPFSQEAESSSILSPSNPSDIDVNPNQRLSSVLLNEFNYFPWSRAVTLALGGRSKLGFINGNIEAPDVSSPNYESWLCKDQLVMSWLLNSIERKVAEIFIFYGSSFIYGRLSKKCMAIKTIMPVFFNSRKTLQAFNKRVSLLSNFLVA
ncbi:unnamed protein product [Prunus armeniaca]|uniref:Retrotransposon Copia-like N-terminal domain-containing protein n=1 Tax=Prunus armeniaca TaxID=36596 RepID=A0A6J5VDD1_PRUAR|nr:unnamed protein product [Prunus armeniaca]